MNSKKKNINTTYTTDSPAKSYVLEIDTLLLELGES